MATPEIIDETTVNDRFAVTIPSPVRSRLDIQAGDKVRWKVTSDGAIDIEIVKQRTRGFEDFEPVDIGHTDVTEELDAVLADEIDRGR